MKTAVLTATCIAVVFASLARADVPVGGNPPEIKAGKWLNVEKGYKLSELKGMVVVLFFWVSFHEGGQQTMNLINSIESNAGLGRARGVIVIGLTDADATRTETVLRREKAFYPVGVESESYKDYRIESFPRAVVIDANGKVAWTGWPANEGGEDLVKAILATLEKTPPTRTHPLEVPKVQAAMDKARESIRTEKYRDAFRTAREAFETAVTGDPLKSQCEGLLDLLECIGRDKVASAELLVQNQSYEQAVAELRTVSDQFRGLAVASTARSRLSAYAKELSEVAEVIKSQESSDDARAALLAAQEQVRARQFGEAYVAFEKIIADYPGTDEAERAENIKGRMENYEDILQMVRDYKAESDCRTWIAQASSYRSAGRTAMAKKLLRQVIEKYPNTSFADEAAQELTRIP